MTYEVLSLSLRERHDQLQLRQERNLITRTDALGVVLTKFYDDLNRLTSNEYDDPVSPGSIG